MVKLFKSEEIDFAHIQDKEQPVATDEQINELYILGGVRVVTEQARYPLNTIVSIVESDRYKLQPSFQRRHRWDVSKKSKLIESLIMNVPIPPVFLYEVDFSYYEVMDGLQRITAIYEFYKNKYRLQGLEYWSEINGRLYSELPTQIKLGIDRRYLSSIILLHETAKDEQDEQQMKQLVFERLNSGGTNLERQEIRNALSDGPLNQLCMRLSSNPHFCKLWRIPETDGGREVSEMYRKMDDVELVLRFFAYRQIDRLDNLPINELLDFFLTKGNAFGSELLARYETLFVQTVKLIYESLGEDAFCLWKRKKGERWAWFRRPTKTAYDSIMQVFSQHLEHGETLVQHAQELRTEMEQFYEQHYSAFDGRNNNLPYTVQRVKLFQNFITDFVEERL